MINLLPVPPKISSTEAQYTATEGSRAVLSCVAEGIPTPTITWKKDNMLLTEIAGKYQAVPDGDLILDHVVVSFLNLSYDLSGLAVTRLCSSSLPD